MLPIIDAFKFFGHSKSQLRSLQLLQDIKQDFIEDIYPKPTPNLKPILCIRVKHLEASNV
jgi:hypothetical protein